RLDIALLYQCSRQYLPCPSSTDAEKRSRAMTQSEWLACREPDLMLDEIEGAVSREQLVEFVRQCCGRILRYLPPETSEPTMVREFAALAGRQSDHDAAIYAYEAALKAARLAPDLRE